MDTGRGEWRPVAETGFRRKKYAVYVWRSVREDGDTKTEKPRRTLEIPDGVARALKDHHAEQAMQKLMAGKAWQDKDLVFCASIGTPLDAANVRRSFRRITKAAGLGECWTPRELRHSFVSIMSDRKGPGGWPCQPHLAPPSLLSRLHPRRSVLREVLL